MTRLVEHSSQNSLAVTGYKHQISNQLSRFLLTTPFALLCMTLLQLLWVMGLWMTSATSATEKLTFLFVYTMLGGAIITLVPMRWLIRLKQRIPSLVRTETSLIVILCFITLIVGIIYAFHQRLWPYDEENSFRAAQMIAEEGVLTFFKNYSEIEWLGRFHPPLTALTYGLSMRLFGVELIVGRLVAVMTMVASILTTYLLGRKLYDQKTGLIAAIFMLSFPLFTRQGTVMMTDVPVMLAFTLAMLLIFSLNAYPTYRLAIGGGIVIGAGMLTKYTMGLIGPVVLAYFLAFPSVRQLKIHLTIIGVIAGGILAVWLASAYQIGVFEQHQTNLVTDFEAGYFLKNSNGRNWLLESLLTKIPSAVGTYSLPFLCLGLWHLVKHRNQSDWFILLWIVIISILLILSLPDHRYFMLIFAALAIMMARGLKYIPQATDKVILLALLYNGGALYLFIDWARQSFVFN